MENRDQIYLFFYDCVRFRLHLLDTLIWISSWLNGWMCESKSNLIKSIIIILTNDYYHYKSTK